MIQDRIFRIPLYVVIQQIEVLHLEVKKMIVTICKPQHQTMTSGTCLTTDTMINLQSYFKSNYLSPMNII